jgi:inorganic phosphate transporter, PiT family
VTFWDAVSALPTSQIIFLLIALTVAYGFEFINGFHDTANAVTTVIYTRTLRPTPAVLYSGAMNFFGVLVGGTAVAFSIVNLLPVDLLVAANSTAALVMVMSLLLAGVIWNLGTWYLGIPVSSSHALIGSILGVGLANSLLLGRGIAGVNWAKAGEVGLALLISPVVGFGLAALLLLAMKWLIPEPRLYLPPEKNDKPPHWVRWLLIGTCGGVSFAHGSNDGQKGMGLILLVLIGFLPTYYALDTNHPEEAKAVKAALAELRKGIDVATQTEDAHKEKIEADVDYLEQKLAGVQSFAHLPAEARWEVRQALFRLARYTAADPQFQRYAAERKAFTSAIEFVPLWVAFGVALALGIGTIIGYQRIVITVGEKIGKTHLTYAQGAAAEVVAAVTILAADVAHAPVSTTQVLSSGVAGTMAANRSGIQGGTCRKILLTWLFTLPGTILLAAGLFILGQWLAG